MIGLQSFAFLVLAGLTQVYSKPNYGDVNYEVNSFPYFRTPPDLKPHDLYTTSIVSHKSGPLCSGFHVKPNAVITAASCVYRETADSLVVISHHYLAPNKTMPGPSLLFFQVNNVNLHSKFNLTTHEHDIAVLNVDNKYNGGVAILNLLSLNAPNKPTGFTDLYIGKYSYDDWLRKFYMTYEPAEADTNIRRCSNDSNSFSFICVSRGDYQPYSYGMADIGMPLILRTAHGDMAMGMFTFRVFNTFKVSYMYENFEANLDFLFKILHEFSS